MAEVDTTTPHDVELPNGRILTGNGGDIEAIRESLEDRHEELHPTPPETTTESKPKQSRGAKRIEEALRDAETARRETQAASDRAASAEKRATELEARLKPAEPSATAPVQPPAQTETTRTKPIEDEIGTKYQTYGDYVEDLADWKAEQRIAGIKKDLDARFEQRIEAERASRNRAEAVAAITQRGRAAYTDFDAVMSTTTVTLPGEILRAIDTDPSGEHLIYALAKDTALADRIKALPDLIQVGRALEQLIPRGRVAEAASTRPVVLTTNAPAPIQPVEASARTTSPTLEELAATGDYDSSGYRERRRAELGR